MGLQQRSFNEGIVNKGVSYSHQEVVKWRLSGLNGWMDRDGYGVKDGA